MSTKCTEKEINWAIEELNKKHPERASREQAIKFLHTLQGLTGAVVK